MLTLFIALDKQRLIRQTHHQKKFGHYVFQYSVLNQAQIEQAICILEQMANSQVSKLPHHPKYIEARQNLLS